MDSPAEPDLDSTGETNNASGSKGNVLSATDLNDTASRTTNAGTSSSAHQHTLTTKVETKSTSPPLVHTAADMTISKPKSSTKRKGLSSAFAATPARVQKHDVFVKPTPMGTKQRADGVTVCLPQAANRSESENIDSNARSADTTSGNKIGVNMHIGENREARGKDERAPAFTPVKMHAKTMSTVLKPSLGAMFAKQTKNVSMSQAMTTTKSAEYSNTNVSTNEDDSLSGATQASAYEQPAQRTRISQERQQQHGSKPASTAQLTTPAQHTQAMGSPTSRVMDRDIYANPSRISTYPRYNTTTHTQAPHNTPCTPAVTTQQKRKSNFSKSLSEAFVTPSLPISQAKKGPSSQVPYNTPATVAKVTKTTAVSASAKHCAKESRANKSARKFASLGGAFSSTSVDNSKSRKGIAKDDEQDMHVHARSLCPMEDASPTQTSSNMQRKRDDVPSSGSRSSSKDVEKYASEGTVNGGKQVAVTSRKHSQPPTDTSHSQPLTDLMTDSCTDSDQHTSMRIGKTSTAPVHSYTTPQESVVGVKRTLQTTSSEGVKETRPTKKQAVQGSENNAEVCAATARRGVDADVQMQVRPPSTDCTIPRTRDQHSTSIYTNTHVKKSHTHRQRSRSRSRSPAPGANKNRARSETPPRGVHKTKPAGLKTQGKAKSFVVKTLRSPEMLRSGLLSPTKSMSSAASTGSGQLSRSAHGSPKRVRSPASPVQQLGDAFSATSIKSRTPSLSSVVNPVSTNSSRRVPAQASAVGVTPAAGQTTSINRTSINSTSTCKSYASTGLGSTGATERKRKRTETGIPNKTAVHPTPVMKKAPSMAALFGGKAKNNNGTIPVSTARKQQPTRRTLGGVALSLLGSGSKSSSSSGKKLKSPTGSFTRAEATNNSTQKQPNASFTTKNQPTYFEASTAEAAEAGAGLGLYDEVRYIIDGLGPTNPVSVRCSSATSLATQCCTHEFRLHMRAHDVVPQVIKAITDLARAPHQALTVCVAHVLLILSDDALTSDFRGAGLALLLKWIRDLGQHGWRGRVSDTLQIPAKSSRNETIKNLQRISTALKKSDHNHCIDPTGEPSLAMLLLHTLSSLTKLLDGFADQLVQKQRLTDISLIFASAVDTITGSLGVGDPDFAMAIHTAEVCLQIFENTTFMNADSLTEENVPFLLTLTENLIRVLRYIDRTISTGVHATALPAEDALKLLTGCVRVLMNLTHIERVRHHLVTGPKESTTDGITCSCAPTCPPTGTCMSIDITSSDISDPMKPDITGDTKNVVEGQSSCGYGMDILMSCALILPPVLARLSASTTADKEKILEAISSTSTNKEGPEIPRTDTSNGLDSLSRKSTEPCEDNQSGTDTKPTHNTTAQVRTETSETVLDDDTLTDTQPMVYSASLESVSSTATVDLGVVDGVAMATGTPPEVMNTSANSENIDTGSNTTGDSRAQTNNASMRTTIDVSMESSEEASSAASGMEDASVLSSADKGKGKAEDATEADEEAQKAKQRLESVEYDLFVHTFGLLVNVLECEAEARQSVCAMEVTLQDNTKVSFMARVADLFELWASEAESSLSDMRSVETLPVGGRARDKAMRQQQRQTELRTLMAYAAYLIGWLVRDNGTNKQRAITAFESPTRPTVSISILVDRLRDFIKLQELMGMPQTEESRKSTDIALTTLVALSEDCQ